MPGTADVGGYNPDGQMAETGTVGTLSICLLALCQQVAAPAASAVPLPSGVWRAWLDTKGGELPFLLELQRDEDGSSAWLLNGAERTPASSVRMAGGEVVLEWGDFDSVLRARIGEGGLALDGTWDKQATATARVELAFHARYGETQTSLPAMPVPGPRRPSHVGSVPTTWAGRYRLLFDGEDEPAVALLHEEPGSQLEGTVLTARGDLRFLTGTRTGDDLLLACFDGGRALLLRAHTSQDGTLRGSLWSADGSAQAWTATRADDAALPDPWTLARARKPEVGPLSFAALDGTTHRLDDRELLGQGCVFLIFGSWCPNSHDATDTLVQFLAAYRERGLKVVGLAFELTADAERSRRVLELYAHRHGVDWPILLAGTADKTQADRVLPFLDRVTAFPTAVFVGRDGTVRAVYSGFTGPAARREHSDLVRSWRAQIERMLN